MSDGSARVAQERWATRVGLILAMAGNAVGLGNFLRFPTQAAQNGGGSFMVAYFVALLLLGLPLLWVEWGLGRHGGRYRKGHLPGMLAAIWRHPAAPYLGVLGLVVPLAVMIYYTVIESWTLAFAVFTATGDYWGLDTQEAMVGYLHSYQGVGPGLGMHDPLTPVLFFGVTLAVNIWVLSKGLAGGIERLARIAMPILFLFAAVLAVSVLLQPPGPTGARPVDGLQFIYAPELSRLGDAQVWLAAAGQIFFTLSIGMGSLAAYASYLSREDDIVLNSLATAATNESAEVVLGSTIAIPAAVTFFGVAGAVAIAQSGAFNLGFVTLPVIFQEMAFGRLLGTLWFLLLFIAGITSSVAMLTPVVAFFREEFEIRRETVAWSLGGVVLVFGLAQVAWLEHGVLDEWDYWAGTFGLVLVAAIQVIVFVWIFGPARAWASIHDGADLILPALARRVLTFVTPVFLGTLLVWWTATDALPILTLQRTAGGGVPASDDLPWIWGARLVLVGFVVLFALLVRVAWKRNGYQAGDGFPEVAPGAVPPTDAMSAAPRGDGR